MDDSQTLSDYAAGEIRAVLARNRSTGKELAEKLEVSRSWVSYRLTGTTEITLNDLQRIAAVLDVEVTALLPGKKVERIAYPDRTDRAAPRTKRLILATPHARPANTNQGADRAGVRRPTIQPYRHSGVPA